MADVIYFVYEIQVCRVSGQVHIKDVGRVSVAWQFVN